MIPQQQNNNKEQPLYRVHCTRHVMYNTFLKEMFTLDLAYIFFFVAPKAAGFLGRDCNDLFLRVFSRMLNRQNIPSHNEVYHNGNFKF